MKQSRKDRQAEYTAATERARTPDGYLVCECPGCKAHAEPCGRSLLDGMERRHHRIFRSQGGPTTAENILIVCDLCHDAHHGIKRIEAA